MEVWKEDAPQEYWTYETAEEFLEYYFNNQPDLFFVAVSENEILGAIMGLIKPWWNGNYIYETEVFVNTHYRRMGISKKLWIAFLETAQSNYSALSLETFTFAKKKFPLSFYLRIGCKNLGEFIILDGYIEELLKNLKK